MHADASMQLRWHSCTISHLDSDANHARMQIIRIRSFQPSEQLVGAVAIQLQSSSEHSSLKYLWLVAPMWVCVPISHQMVVQQPAQNHSYIVVVLMMWWNSIYTYKNGISNGLRRDTDAPTHQSPIFSYPMRNINLGLFWSRWTMGWMGMSKLMKSKKNLPDQTPTFDTKDERLRVLHGNWAYRELIGMVVSERAVTYVTVHLHMHAAYPPMTVFPIVQ